MLLVLSLITLLFTSSAFVSPLPNTVHDHVFLLYFLTQIQFIKNNFFLFLLGSFVLSIIFFRANFDKKYTPIKIFFFSTIQTVVVISLGFFFSFVLLLCVAFVQLNIFSVLSQHKPQLLGLQSNPKIILEKLKNQQNPFIVALTKDDEYQVLLVLAQIASGTKNVYGTKLLPAVPSFLILPVVKQFPAILLFDNTVVVTKHDQKTLQMTSPLLGYLLVKHYFPRRKITRYPQFVLLKKNEYLSYRQNDTKKKIIKIDSELEKISGMISSLSATLESEKRNKQAENLLEDYQDYEEFFKTQKEHLEKSTETVSHEFGVFVPPDSIRIVWSHENTQSQIHYFVTLIHEYLHYASYVSNEKRFASSFFEESLTEYFTRKIIQETFGAETNVGYPLQVEIVTAMTKMIPESELAEIYFTKDEMLLEKALDRVYGYDFYKNNYLLFETLQYSSDPKQSVKIANEIMEKIGGTPVTKKDLVSGKLY